MADAGRLKAEKGRRRLRDLFKRSPRATSPSTVAASQAPAPPLSLQFFPPALVSSPPLSSDPPQVPTPSSSPPILEAPTVPLSGQQSTSLNLWEKVFCKVNIETQEWIQKQGLNSLTSAVAKPEDQIKQLTDLIKEKEKIFEDKDSPIKIKIGNQEIVFRAYIADVIGFLTMAGDAAINFAPPQASAPWAIAKAVLKIPVKQIEQMAALAGTIQLFARIVRRGQVYEILYNNEILPNEGAIYNLHDALIDVYVAATELLARSNNLFGRGIVEQTLNAILRPEQAIGLISDLLEKEQRLSYEAQSCESLRNGQVAKQVDKEIKSLLARLDGVSLPLTRIDDRVARLLEEVENKELERLMDFISSEQFGKGHATYKDTRIQDTGDWLIAHESFQDWQAIASSSTLLCLKGTVGTGKTYLTSRVIDHVRQTLETSSHDEGFAFFYCSRSGPLMQDPLVVLRSFVRQLSYKAYSHSSIQSSVIQRCNMAKREGRSLSYTECKELILESMNLYSKTTIILDALDESDITSYNLAEIVIDMMDKARKPVKIFISSRPDREFLEAFEAKATIMVNSSKQQGDIEKYLADALYSTKFFEKRQPAIQEVIKETFSSRNGGMFRWVYLQTKSLQKCVSDDAIKTWAKMIPRDLMAAYDQLWEDLQNQHNASDMVLAMRAIKWVLCSFTPLKSEIFLEAIRYACEGDCLRQIELRTEQEILSLCQDFLTIDAERKVWMLPHASVAEYFESKGMGLGELDAFVSKILLRYLMTPELALHSNVDVNIPRTPESAMFFPEKIPESFESYVVNTWFKHIQRHEKWLDPLEGRAPETELTAILKRFLGSPRDSSGYYRKWADSLELTGFGNIMKSSNTTIYVMCLCGFYQILRDWWQKDIIDQELALAECKNLSSLDLAVIGGCVPICRYLVGTIGVIDLHQRTYFQAATKTLKGRKKSIMALLIEEAKFDLNMVYVGQDWTFAQYIVIFEMAFDLYGTLQWVLDEGWIDVNRQDGVYFGNVLIAAASKGSLQSVEILLRAGADANAVVKSGNYGSALIAAAAAYRHGQDYAAKVMTLVDSGADVNQIPNVGNYGSALESFLRCMFATGKSDKGTQSLEILQFLLKSGADPAMTCDIGEHGNALAAAAFFGLADLLMMMINVTQKERAIECLHQSRHPSQIIFTLPQVEREAEAWEKNVAEIAAYLADEVGVDKETLRSIGIQDITLKISNQDAFRWTYTIEQN